MNGYQTSETMEKQSTAIDRIREDQSPAAQQRRTVAALAAVGIADFSLISLLQMGYFQSLPDLPGKVFDTKKVNTSQDAVLLGMPDGVISLGGYVMTMLLATAGIRFQKKSRLLDWALAGVVAGQAVGAAQYLYKMAFVQKKVCLYCVAGAAINFAALKPVVALLKSKR